MEEQFSINLKKLRIENELTQKELAVRLKVSRSAIAKWEQGRGLPNISTLTNIAKIFNISIEQLIEKDYSQKKQKNFVRIFGISFSIILIILSIIFYAPRKIMSYIDIEYSDIEYICIQSTNSKYEITIDEYKFIYGELNSIYVIPRYLSYNGVSSYYIYIETINKKIIINRGYLTVNNKTIKYNVLNEKMYYIVSNFIINN